MNIVHMLDIVRHLTGMEPHRVYAEYGTVDTPVDVEDILAVVLKFDGGAIGMIDASTCMVGKGPRDLRISGSNGQIVLMPPFRYITLKAGVAPRTGEWQRLPRLKNVSPRAAFLRGFFGALRRGEIPPAPGQDGLAVQAIMDAAYQSMTIGRPVRPIQSISSAGS